MKEVFKQLITDFQKLEIPRPSPRELPPFDLPKPLRKAFVLVGMRRSGKTWSLYQEMHRLLDAGVDRSQILYLNFEDDRLVGTGLKDMQSILDAYFELFPNLTSGKPLYFFFDEIHEINGWEKFIRRLLDQETMQIYLTGSSAKMLSKEIATSLRGRSLVTEVFPYSFREYLTHLQVEWKDNPSTKERAVINHHVGEFLRWGGFPEVVDLDKQFHREILQSYVDTVIYRDIIDRYHVKNSEVLKKLLIHCLQNPASLLSINKIYRTLKSQGHEVGKSSLYTFMSYFEDAYCIFSVPAFHMSAKKSALKEVLKHSEGLNCVSSEGPVRSEREAHTSRSRAERSSRIGPSEGTQDESLRVFQSFLKPRKIYPVDQGLITAYAIDPNMQLGPALESVVFATLRRSCQELFYFISKAGHEVDFLALFPDQTKALYQASLSLKDPDTRRREIRALEHAMEGLDLRESTIVTLNEEETLKLPQGVIHVIPLRGFLLGLDQRR